MKSRIALCFFGITRSLRHAAGRPHALQGSPGSTAGRAAAQDSQARRQDDGMQSGGTV